MARSRGAFEQPSSVSESVLLRRRVELDDESRVRIGSAGARVHTRVA